MSPNFEKVKRYYDLGLWGINRVHAAVVHSWITAKEYQEITGLEYVAEA